VRINELEIKGQDQPLPAKANEATASEIRQAVEQAKIEETIAAGKNFIEEIEVINNSNSSSEGIKEPEKTKDQAAISEEGNHYRDRKSGNEDLDWIKKEEDLKSALKYLEDWVPSFDKTVEEELDDLAAIYKELLRTILAQGIGDGMEGRISSLDEKLSNLLLKLLNSRLGELEALLDTFGSPEAREAMRKALYYNVTGKSIDKKELHIIFKDLLNQDTIAKEGQNDINASSNKLQGQRKQGMIYQPDGSGRIKNEPGYAGRMAKESYLPLSHGKSKMGQEYDNISGAQVSISPMAEKNIYSSRDLTLAELYAKYINHSGNLFTSPVLSGRSEELFGFLSALMTIKTNAFCIHSGIDKGLATELREAIDRLIDFYIQEEYKRSTEGGRRREGQKAFFQPKNVYKIFYYAMGLYHTNGDLLESANKGIRQAYRQFLKKQEGIKVSEEVTPFFSKEKKDAKEDFKAGKRYLEQDFKEFTELLGSFNENGVPLGVLELSPWGMFIEPEASLDRQKAPSSSMILVGGGVILLILIFVLVFL
jgi:hypothetical protein